MASPSPKRGCVCYISSLQVYAHPPYAPTLRKRELVGAGPLHLAYARPFGRLKAPLGLSLLRFAAQTRTCRGGAPPSCSRKTVRSLKSPTGAFIAALRFANANLSGRGPSILLMQTRTTLFLLCTKSYIVWRKIGVWCSFYWKFIKRKSLKLLDTSRSLRLCFD